MKKTVTFFAYAIVILFNVSVAGANGVMGDNFRLHIPWVIYNGDLFSLDLDAQLGDDPIYFEISGLKQRSLTLSQEAANAAAAFLPQSQTLQIPRASFGGLVYSLDLLLTARNGKNVFDLMGAAPAEDPPDRGALVSATLLESLSISDMVAMLPPAAALFVQFEYAISIYKIVYTTVDPYGNAVNASGLLAVPTGVTQSLPLFSYQHGTEVLKSAAPSADSGADGYLVSALMASGGYLAVAPDYLGMGDSAGLHTYMHAKSSATAVVDLMRAAKTWAGGQTIDLNGQTFLAGYSEGGFVTMAAVREIEMLHAKEFPLTASAPMAGPYSISGVMSQIVLDGNSVPTPYYFPYTLLAADHVYGLADGDEDLFTHPYSTTIPPLFDGQHTGSQINDQLPSAPLDTLSANLLNQLGNDDYAPINLALKDNDLYQWTPGTMMNLYHCTDDDQVPFANSQIAYDSFISNGAAQVALVPLAFGDHVSCAIPAILTMKTWFDGLVTP